MNYFSDEFKKILAEHYVFDAWQFLLNTQRNIFTAEYCLQIVKNSIDEIIAEHHSFQKQLNSNIDNIIRQGKGSVALKVDDMPKDMTQILGIDVSLYFIIEKYIKDFFQCIRNSFDIMGQLINSTLLANEGLDVDRVDFSTIYKKLKNYKSIFPKTFNSVQAINDNITFKYLSAFNNRIKHTYDVKNVISLSVFSDEKKIFINEFQKYGNTYTKEEIVRKIDEIFAFTQKALKSILDSLYDEIKLNKFNNDRIHDLFYYCQHFKDNSNNLTAIYIKVENEITELPNKIRILLLKKRDEIEAYNCDYNDILVRDKNDNFLGRFIAKEDIEKDGLIKYRKYALDECEGNIAFIEHINERYGFKPFLMDGIIVSDKI